MSLNEKPNKQFYDEQKDALCWLNQHKATLSINSFEQLLLHPNLSQWGRQWVNEQLTSRMQNVEKTKQEELFVNVPVPSSSENSLQKKEIHHFGLKI